MTLAAILIQSRFRSFHEQRKFQQSRRAAVLIQQYYRSYKHSLSSLLTKKQNQAARKILRFLLRCRHSPLMDHRPLKQVSPHLLPLFQRLMPVCMTAEGEGEVEEFLDHYHHLCLSLSLSVSL
ncbi:calmodulin-binding transcription activator 1-like isoform X1 [Fundulus heteroclitus]|nr:calmodulin-binding transcription activator 1-like isoform X1 [Fundulus heteroclitus]